MINYSYKNQKTEYGKELRKRVLEEASKEARERLHDLQYNPIVIPEDAAYIAKA